MECELGRGIGGPQHGVRLDQQLVDLLRRQDRRDGGEITDLQRQHIDAIIGERPLQSLDPAQPGRASIRSTRETIEPE